MLAQQIGKLHTTVVVAGYDGVRAPLWPVECSCRAEGRERGCGAAGGCGANAAGHATIADVPLVAYHAWANRGPSIMRVRLAADGGGHHVVDPYDVNDNN
jgi:hypothetical protein